MYVHMRSESKALASPQAVGPKRRVYENTQAAHCKQPVGKRQQTRPTQTGVTRRRRL